MDIEKPEEKELIGLLEAADICGDSPEEMLLNEDYTLYVWADLWGVEDGDNTDIHHGPYPLAMHERQNIRYNGFTLATEHAGVLTNDMGDIKVVKISPSAQVNFTRDNVFASRSEIERFHPPMTVRRRVSRNPLYRLANKIYEDYCERGKPLPDANALLQDMIDADRGNEGPDKLNIRYDRGKILYTDYDGKEQEIQFNSFRSGLTRYRNQPS